MSMRTNTLRTQGSLSETCKFGGKWNKKERGNNRASIPSNNRVSLGINNIYNAGTILTEWNYDDEWRVPQDIATLNSKS